MSELDSLRAEVESLRVNDEQLAGRVRHLEKCLDTLQTVWWKRVWFRVNGWPGIRDLDAPAPRRRVWHRWVRP